MVSLLSYRRAVMAELGPFVVNTTTTAASDAFGITCSSLVNANANASQFQNCWVYLNATGANLSACRQVATTAGYDPDTGAFTVARAFATVVSSGVSFEISSKLPAVTDDLGVIGVREILNDVLRTMPPIDLLPVTGTTGQSAYDVTTTYPWLTEKSQILGIYFQDTGDDYPVATNHLWDWLYDADAPKLLLPTEPYQTGETFYVKARRPAHTWIKTGGTWAADTDGLQDDSDEALPLLAVVKAQALSAAYRMLGAKDGPGEYVAYYRERESFWSAKAYAMRWWDEQRADEDRGPRLRMVSRTFGFGRPRSYR